MDTAPGSYPFSVRCLRQRSSTKGTYPLVPLAGGRATAAAIDGAELVVIPGMGHDLPRQLWPRLVELIVGIGNRAERALAQSG